MHFIVAHSGCQPTLFKDVYFWVSERCMWGCIYLPYNNFGLLLEDSKA